MCAVAFCCFSHKQKSGSSLFFRWERFLSNKAEDPCLPSGFKEKRSSGTVLRGTGSLYLCMKGLEDALLGRDKPCALQPCSIAAVHQPKIDFWRMRFYGVSEFWNTSNSIFNLEQQYDPKSFRKAAEVTMLSYNISKKGLQYTNTRLSAKQALCFLTSNSNAFAVQCYICINVFLLLTSRRSSAVARSLGA